MESQLISIIVAAYNIKECLPACVESLLKQTYSSLEIILVDDGSTDGTAELCDEYALKHQNIKAIHRENGGLSAARNTGLSAAGGSYIGYVDGDDFIEPDMYRDMYRACVETGADMAICAYRQIGVEGNEQHFTGNRIELSREKALDWYVNGHEQYHIYNSVWSRLFKRNIISELQFPEGRKSEDIMYTTIAMTRAQKCVFLDTPYYNYVMNREGSIMNSSLHERRFHDEIPFWKEQMDYFRSIGMWELSERATYQFYRRMLYYFVDFKERKMHTSARQLLEMLLSEKEQIAVIYGKPFVASGDRARMKLALTGGNVYYYTVLLYDKFIIPLRRIVK